MSEKGKKVLGITRIAYYFGTLPLPNLPQIFPDFRTLVNCEEMLTLFLNLSKDFYHIYLNYFG